METKTKKILSSFFLSLFLSFFLLSLPLSFFIFFSHSFFLSSLFPLSLLLVSDNNSIKTQNHIAKKSLSSFSWSPFFSFFFFFFLSSSFSFFILLSSFLFSSVFFFFRHPIGKNFCWLNSNHVSFRLLCGNMTTSPWPRIKRTSVILCAHNVWECISFIIISVVPIRTCVVAVLSHNTHEG